MAFLVELTFGLPGAQVGGNQARSAAPEWPNRKNCLEIDENKQTF
jgi:hypothetical protein